MERREDALREALANNDVEKERWQNYKKEQQTAIENMNMFTKKLSVDVMVPVGRRAFMPGHLIHTNELLVGHYQGYFSKCSVHKAKEICNYRVHMAEKHLEKLQVEADLWQNKLAKPYEEGVLPSTSEERDIIEEYNEDKEQRWREQHTLSVKQAKLREKQERKEGIKVQKSLNSAGETYKEQNEEELFKMLEDAELMEELEKELESLEVNKVSDSEIRKLMSGESKLPSQEKSRIAHNPNTLTELVISGVVKKTDLQLNANTQKISATNNNHFNPEAVQCIANASEKSSASDLEFESEVPNEVQILKKEAKFLTPIDQIGFYEYQIEIIKQKLLKNPLKTQQEIERKMYLLNVLEHLEELLEIVEETVGAEELAEKDVQTEYADGTENEEKIDLQILKRELNETIDGTSDPSNKKPRRRISFASENQLLEFRKNETVSQMLINPEMTQSNVGSSISKQQRHIISLSNEEIESQIFINNNSKMTAPITTYDRKEIIRNKVENNLKYFTENQSIQDFDLVNKILDSSTNGKRHTLQIIFAHSSQPGLDLENDGSIQISNETPPGTPADFYNLYLKQRKDDQQSQEAKTIFVNSYIGEEDVKVPVLKEADREKAYEDPKLKFSKPNVDRNDKNSKGKSILRNKSAVQQEVRNLSAEKNQNNKKNKSLKMKDDDEEYTSAYNKVMNDVFESPLTAPEPLPDVEYVDSHMPKKRISRFKQMRNATKL